METRVAREREDVSFHFLFCKETFFKGHTILLLILEIFCCDSGSASRSEKAFGISFKPAQQLKCNFARWSTPLYCRFVCHAF